MYEILKQSDLTEDTIIKPNTLIHGDCLEVMKSIPDRSADMILADVPYQMTNCKWDIAIPFEPMWEQLKRIIKKNGAIVLFGSEPFSSALRMSNIKQYKYDWKWDKVVGSNFVHAKIMPLKVYEDIIVFHSSKKYNPQMVERDTKNERESGTKKTKNNFNNVKYVKSDTKGKMKFPVNKITINRLSGELNSKHIVHPTQKPVALLEYLIKTYTNENETVLDFTAGSFSTGVAAQNLNRQFIGIELDENYFNIGMERMNVSK